MFIGFLIALLCSISDTSAEPAARDVTTGEHMSEDCSSSQHDACGAVSLLQKTARAHGQEDPLKSSSSSIKGDLSQARIPNKLLLSYKQELLPPYTSRSIDDYMRNLNRTLSLHHGIEVLFYDDKDCQQTLARVHSTALARDFADASTGMHKSAMCRLAMLYEHGGYYVDNDIEMLSDVRGAIPTDVSISAVLALPRANPQNTVFDAFLAAEPQHPVIMDAMDGMWAWYLGRHHLSKEGLGRKEHALIASEVLGNSLRKWLGVDDLKAELQHRRPSLGEIFTQSSPKMKESAYLFSESENALQKYHLQKRNGRGESCNVAVVGGQKAIAWSRLVGADEWCKKIEQPSSVADGALFQDRTQDQSVNGIATLPNKLLFNYKHHLLTSNTTEEADLIHNVQNTIRFHPDMEVIFYDNNDCSQAVRRMHSNALADFFDNEDTGMFKSDICRLAMLYEHGGYYFDNDLEVLKDVRTSLPAGIALSSVLALPRCNRPNALFQAFAAAEPRHPVIKDALDGTLRWYETREYENTQGLPQGFKRLMGTEVLGESVMKWLRVDNLKGGLQQQHTSPSESLLQKDRPGSFSFEFAYFFEEAEGNLGAYHLQHRQGIGSSCNVFVKNGMDPIAWSRFVGSGQWCDKVPKPAP